jgi:hypothetical protein
MDQDGTILLYQSVGSASIFKHFSRSTAAINENWGQVTVDKGFVQKTENRK